MSVWAEHQRLAPTDVESKCEHLIPDEEVNKSLPWLKIEGCQAVRENDFMYLFILKQQKLIMNVL